MLLTCLWGTELLNLHNHSGSKEMSLIADMIISHLNHGYQSSPFLDFAEEQMIHKILGQFYH